MARARIDVTILPSTKDRLLAFCRERDISQGDVVDDALKNFFEKQDRRHSAPDLVLDRLNQLTLSVMQLNMAVGEMKDQLEKMERRDEG